MAERSKAIDATQQTAARVAGFAYLIPVAFVLAANFGLRKGLITSGDVAETVRRITEAMPRFRLSIVFDVVYSVGVVVLLTALYVVLRPVNRHVAALATLLKLVYAGTAMMMVLSWQAIARLLANSESAQALGADHVQMLVKVNLSATIDEYYVGLAFWALSATLIGWLWFKSGYVPKALALFGLVSAAWCTLCAFAYIGNPAFSHLVNLWCFDSPLAIFDIMLSFWLLFKGLQGHSVAAAGGRVDQPTN
jgi:Domain of unknown function (DUF4386)